MRRYKRKKPEIVNNIEDYKDAWSPSKDRTIHRCNDEKLLKEIFQYEKQRSSYLFPRMLCLKFIKDKDFLEKVAKRDPNPTIRLKAARKHKGLCLMLWLKNHETDKQVKNYAKGRWNRFPKSYRYLAKIY